MDEAQVYVPHVRQRLVMLCPCNEILYGGAAGAGKSFAIIFSWMQHQAIYGAKAKGLVIRKTMPELEDLIQEFQRVFSTLQFPPKWNETKKTFTHPDGAILELGYLDKESDKFRYHGRRFTFEAWDELTLWDTCKPYEFLMTRARSAEGVPVTVLATTNPIGVGAGWVKKRWRVDQFPDGMVPFSLFINLKDGMITEENPELLGLSDEELFARGYKKWTRIFIPGRLKDNPSLEQDGAYRAQLMMQGDKTRKALLDGVWDAIDGQFFEEWDASVHVTPWFKVPEHCRRWMAMDWGTADPYCCLWAAELDDGRVVVYDELYGQHSSGEENRGTLENASQVALKIRERERLRGEFITERYADPTIFSKMGHEVTIGGLFASEGVVFQPSGRRDKEGRIALFREYLKVVNKNSRIVFMNNCRNTIRTIPMMMFDKNNSLQFDTKLEDHAVDTVLYLLSKNPKDHVKASKLFELNNSNVGAYSEMGVW